MNPRRLFSDGRGAASFRRCLAPDLALRRVDP